MKRFIILLCLYMYCIVSIYAQDKLYLTLNSGITKTYSINELFNVTFNADHTKININKGITVDTYNTNDISNITIGSLTEQPWFDNDNYLSDPKWMKNTILTSNVTDNRFAGVYSYDNLTIGDGVTVFSSGISQLVIKVKNTLYLGKNAVIQVRNGYYAEAPKVLPSIVNKKSLLTNNVFDNIYMLPNVYGKGGDGGNAGDGEAGIRRPIYTPGQIAPSSYIGEYGGYGGGGGAGGYGGGIGGRGGAGGYGYKHYGNSGQDGEDDGGTGGVGGANTNSPGSGGYDIGIGGDGKKSTDNVGAGGAGGGGNGGNGAPGSPMDSYLGGGGGHGGRGGGGGGYGGGVLYIAAKNIVYDPYNPPKFIVSGQVGGAGYEHGKNGSGGLLIVKTETSKIPLSFYQLNDIYVSSPNLWGHGNVVGQPGNVLIYNEVQTGKENNDNENSDDTGIEGSDTDFQAVDLGLSVKWASKNINAANISMNGLLAGWGDATGKCRDSLLVNYGGLVPLRNISGSAYDIASVQLKGGWRLPTKSEFQELIDNCKISRIKYENTYQYKLTSLKNNKSIYLPASDNYAHYWTSNSINSKTFLAAQYRFETVSKTDSVSVNMSFVERNKLNYFRPVLGNRKDNDTIKIEPALIDMGLSVKWSEYNLGADNIENEGFDYQWGNATGTYQTDISSCGGLNPLRNISNSEYDIAKSILGNGWRIPSDREIRELLDNCTSSKEKIKNNYRIKLTSKLNGNSIYFVNEYMDSTAVDVDFWSSNCVNNEDKEALHYRLGTYKESVFADRYFAPREFSFHIRPVKGPVAENDTITTTISPVDLGLSVKWSNMDLNASDINVEGSRFAWGDPTDSYKDTLLIHYGGNNPPIDIGNTEYDIVKAKLGKGWRMPSKNEFQELFNNCSVTYVKSIVCNYFKFVSKRNGKYIILPGTFAEYWTSNCMDDDRHKAITFEVNYWNESANMYEYYLDRFLHYYRIRPVMPI